MSGWVYRVLKIGKDSHKILILYLKIIFLISDPSEKLSFCMEFVMTCDAPWVRAPPCLQMSYMIRAFQVSDFSFMFPANFFRIS